MVMVDIFMWKIFYLFYITWSRGLDLKVILAFVKIQMTCNSIMDDNSALFGPAWLLGVLMWIFDGIASLGLLGPF